MRLKESCRFHKRVHGFVAVPTAVPRSRARDKNPENNPTHYGNELLSYDLSQVLLGSDLMLVENYRGEFLHERMTHVDST